MFLFLSFFCSHHAQALLPLGISPEFGLEEPQGKGPSSLLSKCEDTPELAPGVKDPYCLGPVLTEAPEEEIMGVELLESLRNSISEEQVRILVAKNPMLRGGAAILTWCMAGLLDVDHVSCSLDYEF